MSAGPTVTPPNGSLTKLDASVDSIVFLASLVSDRHAVDSKLDTLRSITLRLPQGNKPSANDLSRLNELQEDLKDYLIHRDPIRSFTAATLDQTLADHFNSHHRSTRKEFILILSSILAIYLICVALTPGSLALFKRFFLPAAVLVSMLYGAIAWLFLSSRQNFKTEIRNVYNSFCGGITLGAIGSIQFPLIFAFPHIAAIPAFSYIGFVVPYFIMCIAFYFGANLYARQLNLSQRLWSVPWVSAISLVIAILLISLPHSSRVNQVFFYDLSLVSIGIDVWLSLAATVLSFRVAKRITPRYQRSMWLFGLGQAAQGVGCIGFTTLVLVYGPTPALAVGIGAIPYILSATFLLFSAYSFKDRSQT
jgi:uncharacterized membrane protein YiaA